MSEQWIGQSPQKDVPVKTRKSLLKRMVLGRLSDMRDVASKNTDRKTTVNVAMLEDIIEAVEAEDF